ncbi:sensor histidine kinase [Hyphococcus sp.]|uniref:sensor histidine kinase n=1 Tax=Hyphococcus sp. TaxID=2038636 RepID=UPI003CCBB2EC
MQSCRKISFWLRTRSPQRFEERLGNLAQTQEQLALSQWDSTDLGLLVRKVLREFSGEDSGAINITSETVHVSAHAANNIAMALFELATNSLKYGALSVDEGKVDVTVSQNDGEIALDWRETGGPPVIAPERPGLGLLLIRDACPAALNGEASLDFVRDGVKWRLRFPAEGNG